MKGVPEEEEGEGEGEVWSSLTTPPPKLPCTLIIQGEEGDPYWGAEIPEPPDGGWGWVIVLASFMCNVVVDGIGYSFGIFLIHFVDYYKAPKGKTAWVGSLLTGCYLSAGPIVSALTNKFGCRPVTICGSIISCAAFLLSTVAPSVDFLMVTYGIMGGVGFGLIYLPAIVTVGYYFSTKRAFATGIAVCGSGLGTFVFAPLTQFLLDLYDWKGALLILAGMALNCCVFGALMRPLEAKPRPKQVIPALNGTKVMSESELKRLAEDGAKVPLLNTEPGVQSTLNLDEVPRQNSLLPSFVPDDQLRSSIGGVPGLEVSRSEAPSDAGSTQHVEGISLGTLMDNKPINPAVIKIAHSHTNVKDFPRRFTIATMPAGSAGVLAPSAHHGRASAASGPRGESWSAAARRNQQRRASKKDLARPLYRKDIFYSGSIVNLPQYRQSRADIRTYMASVTTIPDDEIPKFEATRTPTQKRRRCPKIPKSMAYTLKEALDFSLLKDRPFLLACVANVFGMIGFYVPFVYIVDSSLEKGIAKDPAALLLSIIGITNLVGRLVFGYIVDRARLKAIDVNNACLVVSSLATMSIPFCLSYASIVTACTFFSVFISAYISLTSIILVDMVGLDRLTNSFGLLCLFRGFAGIIGPPLAGTVYDLTASYDIPFYLAGCLMMLSSLCTFLIRWLPEGSPTVQVEPPTPCADENLEKPNFGA